MQESIPNEVNIIDLRIPTISLDIVPTNNLSKEKSNIEVLTGTARVVTLPNVQTSITIDILLQDIRRVNGELFINLGK